MAKFKFAIIIYEDLGSAPAYFKVTKARQMMWPVFSFGKNFVK